MFRVFGLRGFTIGLKAELWDLASFGRRPAQVSLYGERKLVEVEFIWSFFEINLNVGLLSRGLLGKLTDS